MCQENRYNPGQQDVDLKNPLRLALLKYTSSSGIQLRERGDRRRLYVVVATVLFYITSQLVYGDRLPFKQPQIEIEFSDTTNDWEDYGAKDMDSQPHVHHDTETGDYFINYRGPDGETIYTIEWTPLSQLSLKVETVVVESKDGRGFEYKYILENSRNSRQSMKRFILCDTSRPHVSKLPSKDWELLRIWASGGEQFICLMPVSGLSKGIEPGDTLNGFSFSSRLLPTIVNAKAVGYGRSFIRDNSPYEEVPYSFELALRPYLMRNDCVSGEVVGPGSERVQIESLKRYLESSIANGWLDAGKVCDRITTLVKQILLAHKQKKTQEVLDELQRLNTFVKEEYAKKESPILSEAYGLLFFNSKFLLTHYTGRH